MGNYLKVQFCCSRPFFVLFVVYLVRLTSRTETNMIGYLERPFEKLKVLFNKSIADSRAVEKNDFLLQLIKHGC